AMRAAEAALNGAPLLGEEAPEGEAFAQILVAQDHLLQVPGHEDPGVRARRQGAGARVRAEVRLQAAARLGDLLAPLARDAPLEDVLVEAHGEGRALPFAMEPGHPP